MKLTMKNVRVFSIPELEQLLATSKGLEFVAEDTAEVYAWIAGTLKGYGYRKLRKHERGVVIAYIRKLTGYSLPQTKRLIGRWVQTTKLQRKTYERHHFNGMYSRADGC